jgi:predicted enzyme related to lactoylglutathione lyase
MPYLVIKTADGHSNGGIRPPMPPGTPPFWLVYFATDDLDGTLAEVSELGGSVLMGNTDIGIARIGVAQDPQGAVFALYSNPKATDTPPRPQLGHASWHELATSEHTSAFSFYQNLLGWHVTSEMDMGPGMGVYRMFAPEGSKDAFGGMYTKPPQQPGPPAWLPYIKVANAKAATDTAKKLGATIFHGPAQVPGGGWITMAADPQGAAFAVHETPAPSPVKKSAARKKSAPKRSAQKKAAAKKKSRPVKKKAAPKRKSAATRKVAKKRRAGSKK